MRFDPERVVALADEWNYPRLSRTEGERRAADAVAEQFEAAGSVVEQVKGNFTSGAFALLTLYTLYFGMIAWIMMTKLSAPAGVGVALLLLVPLFMAAWWAEWPLWASGRPRMPPHVIGRIASKPRPSVCLILLTGLNSPVALKSIVSTLVFIVLFLITIRYGISPWLVRQARSPLVYAVLLVLTQWIIAIGSLLSVGARSARLVQGDNRTGLALLVELARTLPARLDGRVELCFVASSQISTLGPRLAEPRNERRPTLIVLLNSPGCGAEIRIGGEHAPAIQAVAAAKGLWIPNRLDWRAKLKFATPFRQYGIPCVNLLGRSDDTPINSALLAATAQLVTEIALRWARQAEKAAPVP